MGCGASVAIQNYNNRNLKDNTATSQLSLISVKEDELSLKEQYFSESDKGQELQQSTEATYNKMSSNTRLPPVTKNEKGFLVSRSPPVDTLPESVMPVTELFNLISIGYRVPHITDPLYMLIIDCREYALYLENHIITARHCSALDQDSDCLLDGGACDKYAVIVVYGKSTEDQKARDIYERINGKDLYVQIIEGGFPKFINYAPFLCTGKHFQSNMERRKNIITYPSVVLQDSLYQGGAVHAENKVVINNLKITHVVNVTTEVECPFPDLCKYLHLKFADEGGANLSSVFERAADFIAAALSQNDTHVLVHCVMGVSRSSSVTIAFLMKYYSFTLKDAYKFLKDRRSVAAPNTGFVRQLVMYEQRLFGEEITSPDDILFPDML